MSTNSLGGVTVGLVCGLTAHVVLAATPLKELHVSPDIWVSLSGGVVSDENVALDSLLGTPGSVTPGTCGGACAPPRADLDGYEILSPGMVLVSFDIAVQLPASGGGTLSLDRSDVALFDTVLGEYSVVFDAETAGVPDRANTDAVAIETPGSLGSLLLSFDIAVTLSGVAFDDADLALWDGVTFTKYFDAAAQGVPTAADLDAAHRLDPTGNLLLSFDIGGEVGGLTFFDEDLLEFDAAIPSWEMAYDGSAFHNGWTRADLDAASAITGCGNLTFDQTIRATGQTGFEWDIAQPFFEFARGDFVTSSEIGGYAFDLIDTGSGTSLTDPLLPPVGLGLWYLVKPECPLPTTSSSWQTSPGAEPGRDAALP